MSGELVREGSVIIREKKNPSLNKKKRERYPERISNGHITTIDCEKRGR